MTSLQPKLRPPSKELLRDRRLIAIGILCLAGAVAFLVFRYRPFRGPTELLNVSYDASREFYAALNEAYAASSGERAPVRVTMSHAGSARQARSLMHGHLADVVSLASAYDVDAINGGARPLAPDWRERFPNGGAPFHSSVAIVVRQGNPKGIRDWADLRRPGVSLALPSPDSSGAGRWATLALYAEALASAGGDAARARQLLQAKLIGADLLDAGARRCLALFLNNSDADAFLTWESDALRLAALGFADLEAVFPARSIRAEPRIAIVARHVEDRGTADLAAEYLDFHYTPQAQKIAASFGLRPLDPAAATEGAFPPTELYAASERFPEGEDVWTSLFGSDGFFQTVHDLRRAYLGVE